MASKLKKSGLADKINSLITAKPTNFDSDDDAEDTKAKIIDHYDESDDSDSNFRVSEIRRRNVDLLDQLDKRYVGKKVSRKDVHSSDDALHSSGSEGNEEIESTDNEVDNDDDGDDDDDDDSNNYMSIDEEVDSFNDNSEADEGESDVNEDSSYDYDSEINLTQYAKSKSNAGESNDGSSDAEYEKNFQTMSQSNVRADIDKGHCVRSQLKLWENLLEVRIQLQKCLVTSNQMPQHDVYKSFIEDTEYSKKINDNQDKLKLLLNNMLQLQHFLLKQYPETIDLCRQNKKRKAEDCIGTEAMDEDEEIPSSMDDESGNEEELLSNNDARNPESTLHKNKNACSKKLKLDNYEKILNENHKSYTDYRNSVIQKWNDKTRLTSGKVNKGVTQTTLKQIEFALSDKEKLYKRTRLKRSEYKIVGKMEATNNDNEGRRIQEYDCEIYDDDDFYHQLLRDLIEYKSADITDPVQLSKQWIQLQNMRRKMKRKIDTRATKGRRIRYNVHNKLVNFMAPITVNDTWTDQAKDELYNSLFDKIKTMHEEIGR